MLYLQIASPKSSVLNFLDSNSFEVIISIFQRTEKVPDMERLRSNKMLNLLNSAVEILRNKHKHGEQYYWILYYSYLSPQQLQNTDEIIESLMPHIANISKRTYYRKRPEAVQALSSILWGYSSKDCLEMLNRFIPDN